MPSPFQYFCKFCQVHTFDNAYLPVSFQALVNASLRGHRAVKIALAILLAKPKNDDKTHGVDKAVGEIKLKHRDTASVC